MLLNILQHRTDPSTENYLAPNMNSAKAKKHCNGGGKVRAPPRVSQPASLLHEAFSSPQVGGQLVCLCWLAALVDVYRSLSYLVPIVSAWEPGSSPWLALCS